MRISHINQPRKWALLLVALLSVSFGISQTSVVHASSNGLVISQVYGGGGTGTSIYSHDFVELFNAGSSSISLNGFSVQTASSSGTFGTVITLPNVSLAAGQYYLIQFGSNGGGTTPLPTPDLTDAALIPTSNGKVALVSNTTLLACGGAAGDCFPNANIIDFVGFGTANNAEGGAAATGMSETNSVRREVGGCTDTDNNSADFEGITAFQSGNPRNTATTAAPCPAALDCSGIYTLPDNAPDTLIEAIECANDNADANIIDMDGQTVTLTESVGDYIGETGLPEITTDITIQNGTITRGSVNQFRLLQVSPTGILTLQDMTLTNGGGATYTSNGGMISSSTDSTITIINSTVSGGSVSNSSNAGGIFASGTFTMVNSTVSGNTAGRGSGMALQNGPAIITNSVISGNVATSILGGGAMYIPSVDVTITNSTITGNYATTTGATRPGGILSDVSGANLILQNTTVWGNTNGDGTAPQIVNDSAFGSNTVTNSIIQGGQFGALDIDPLFVTPLAASATPSTAGDFRLSDSSPAIDAGNNSLIPGGVTVDLDGNPRRYDDTGVADTGSGTAPVVDLGAYERQTNSDTCAAIIFPYTLPDNAPTTLVTAIQCAEANGAGADTIDLNGQTITVTDAVAPQAALPHITTSITIQNGSITRGGINNFRFFYVTVAGTLTLDRITLTNGSGIIGGNFDGGAINNYGTTIIRNSTLSGNTMPSGFGGVVFNNPDATLNIINSLISGNRATTGGGIRNRGNLTVTNSTIAGNYASSNGGGIANAGTFTVTLNNSVVYGNEAPASPDIEGDVTTSNNSLVGVNPSFVSLLDASTTAPTTGGDYRLDTSSVAIDAGDNSLASGITTDLDNNPRFVDDTGVADTGSGTAPIVDMGAYEKQTNSPVTNDVDYCNLQFPTSFTVTSGSTSPFIYGRIYEDDGGVLTSTPGAHASILGQVGYGPISSDPTGNGSWTWFTATFNTQLGNDDEYRATFTAPTVGSATQYAYTYRFSLDSGTTYTYCDTDGNGTNGGLSFSTAALGTMTVNPVPTISINDVSLNEGNSGTTSFVFTVSLSGTSTQTVTVDAATADGTATTADSDYAANTQTLTFAPGETSKTFTVLVNGDTTVEPDETFFVNLTNIVNATPSDTQGLGTIQNDDVADPCVAYTFPYTLSGNTPEELIQAINCANINGVGSDTINLNGQTVTLTGSYTSAYGSGTGLPEITTAVVIQNGTITRSSADLFRFFIYSGSSLTLNNITLSNGNPEWDGGAIWGMGSSTLIINNSRIIGNYGNYGGAIFIPTAGTAVITNTLLSGNRAGSPGGAIRNRGNLTLNNSTIAGNFTTAGTEGGGGIANNGGTVVLNNSIVYGNESSSFPGTNNIRGTYTANNSFVDVDPSFVNLLDAGDTAPTTGGDYRLADFSTAIDAGDNSLVPGGVTTDLAGNPRFFNDTGVADTGVGSAPIVDIGAYEKQTISMQADLSITKTDGVTSVTPGGSVTYTITASNAGPSNASGATVADTFPASLTGTWTCVGAGGGTCTAAGSGNINDTVNLPAGGSVTYTVSATLSPSATGTLSNTATVSSVVTDPNPANNSATDSDTIDASADLAITKTDGVTSVTPGGSVTYTITASNAGPSNVSGATVADTLPAVLTGTWTCVGAGGGTCTAAGAGNINDTVNLPAGGSVTYTVSTTLTPSATGTLSNTATVSSLVTDPNPANNSATDTDTIDATADLAITKTDGLTSVTPGGSVTYTITASNAGPSNASGATVADTLPAVLTGTWTCVGAGGGTCTAAGTGNINDTVNLPAGGSVTYTVSATISPSATGTLSNTATVSSLVTDPNPANNSATDTDTIDPSADLAITKTDGVTTVTPGGSVTYTITASNAGPSSVSGATVADTLPAVLTGTWTCVGADGGTCTAAGAGNINDTVNLPAGGSVTYTVSATISGSASGTLSNTATVSSVVTDPNPANNSATDTDTIDVIAPTELLQNGGFEIAGTNAKSAANWLGLQLTVKDVRNCETPEATEIAFEGNCAFRFRFNGPLQVTRILKQVINDPAWGAAGDTLTLTVQVKTIGMQPGAKAMIKVTYDDGTIAKTKLSIPTGTTAYAPLLLTHVLDQSVSKAQVVFRFGVVNGKAWIDDASLTLTPASVRTGYAQDGSVLPIPAAPDGFRGSN